MSVIYTGKLSGRTSSSADGSATGIVATRTVTLDSDGWLRWSDANSKPRALQVSGDLGELLTFLFTGTNGITHALFK